jgi:hypothetical protein
MVAARQDINKSKSAHYRTLGADFFQRLIGMCSGTAEIPGQAAAVSVAQVPERIGIVV